MRILSLLARRRRRGSRVHRVVVIAVLAACGPAPAPQLTSPAAHGHDRCASYDGRPQGTAADYVPPKLEGFTIAPPLMCEREANIRVERTSGTRRLGIAGAGRHRFGAGCIKPPASAEECPILNWGVPLMAAAQALRSRGILLNGIGAGPCADIQGDFAAWNMSIGVTSWAEAATAVRLVADEMNRYDVAGYLGVAVRGIPCGVAE